MRNHIKNMNNQNCMIFIGGIGLGTIPTGGEAAKNYIFLKYFKEIYDEVVVFDTLFWRKEPWIVLKILWAIYTTPQAIVFISSSAHSVAKLCRFLPNSRLRKNVFYSVVGGAFHEVVHCGGIDKQKLVNMKRIMVQSEEMRTSLLSDGLDNVIKVVNTKFIPCCPKTVKKTDNKIHFVFLSRITELKGCNVIFDSVEQLCKEGYSEQFDVTFYGHVVDDYKVSFEHRLKHTLQCYHAGIIDLTNPENYNILASYDVMLFPTFWPGEGFPGVLVDAFIARLPIIASNWHYNAEIITDGGNGFLIPPKDVVALTEKMQYMIDNPQIIKRMSESSLQEATKYDIHNVYSNVFMQSIGML